MDKSPPKLFISYSWSSSEHEQWVIDLATQLVESGVDVILDKWALKEGHDTFAFMEQMVTDPSVSKVAIISDKTYAEKADGRSGGVGTEAQIISAEVYAKREQTKFVAVVPVRDSTGQPYLPTYYKGKKYIDFSALDRYGESLEQLLRWIYDKPMYERPALGKPPAFLSDATGISLGTTAVHTRLVDALRGGRPYALGALDEYLQTFSDHLERLRIDFTDVPDAEIDERVAHSIGQFVPAKNEFVETLSVLARFLPTPEVVDRLHRFFERLLKYLHRPDGATTWSDYYADNFNFIVHELFLYTIAILVRDEHFALASTLIGAPFYVAWADGRHSETVSYREFREPMRSFEVRNHRLGRYSARADLLKGRADASGFPFATLMQADFVLYLRAAIEPRAYYGWWPETLVYATHSYSAFEIFARSVSKAYFDRMKVMLGVESPIQLTTVIAALAADRKSLPGSRTGRISPSTLAGAKELATRA